MSMLIALLNLFKSILYLQKLWRIKLHARHLSASLGLITLMFVTDKFICLTFMITLAVISIILNIHGVRQYACRLHGYGYIFNQPWQKPAR